MLPKHFNTLQHVIADGDLPVIEHNLNTNEMVIKVSDSVENGRKVASSSSKYRDDSVWMCHCFKGYCVPCLNRTEKFARCLRVSVGLLGTVCLLPRVCGIG